MKRVFALVPPLPVPFTILLVALLLLASLLAAWMVPPSSVPSELPEAAPAQLTQAPPNDASAFRRGIRFTPRRTVQDRSPTPPGPAESVLTLSRETVEVINRYESNRVAEFAAFHQSQEDRWNSPTNPYSGESATFINGAQMRAVCRAFTASLISECKIFGERAKALRAEFKRALGEEDWRIYQYQLLHAGDEVIIRGVMEEEGCTEEEARQSVRMTYELSSSHEVLPNVLPFVNTPLPAPR